MLASTQAGRASEPKGLVCNALDRPQQAV